MTSGRSGERKRNAMFSWCMFEKNIRKENVYEQDTSIQYKKIQLLLWFCQGKNCAANEANYNFCP